MKELKKQFIGISEVKDMIFDQIKVSNKVFLYKVSNNGLLHYEVFKMRKNTLYNNISYPKSTSFGKWAWTYKTLALAEAKFKELNK